MGEENEVVTPEEPSAPVEVTVEGTEAVAQETTSAEVSGDTPVESEAVAESPEQTVAVEGDPQEAAPEEVAASPEEETKASPYDEFNWDEWDGALDNFADDVRPWAEKVVAHHKKEYGELELDLKTLQGLYDALLVGNEDPRVGSLTAERDTFKGQHEALQKEFDQYKLAIEAVYVQQAERELTDYLSANPDISEDKEKYELLSNLIGEEWDLREVTALMDMPEEAREVARKARKDGVPAHYAVRLGKTQHPPAPKPKPRPAAILTAGATTGSVSPHAASKTMSDAQSLEERRAMAVQRSLKLHSGRR